MEVKNKTHGEAYVCLMCGPMVDKEHRKQSVAVCDCVLSPFCLSQERETKMKFVT